MSRKSGSSSQTTCYVIAYDIPDDRRRTKVHQILMGFGKWTQYSLFECFLSRKDLILLQSKLDEYLKETQDSVRFYLLCANCVEKVQTIGGPPPQDEILFSYKPSREGRSDKLSKRRPSRLSRRGFIGFSSENDPTCSEKTSPKNECLENACLFWLPMLHYEHRCAVSALIRFPHRERWSRVTTI